MKAEPADLAASTSGRLRNLARERGIGFEFVLRRYALERLLLRLSLSSHRDRFVLKGAMLFTAWLADPFRPTRDLDLLGFGDPAISSIVQAFGDICRQHCPGDGLAFDVDDLIAEPIREDQLYGGIRIGPALFSARRVSRFMSMSDSAMQSRPV